MIRLSIVIIVLFISSFGFTQSKTDDYEIYSSILNRVIEDWFDGPLNSIIVIEKYDNRYKQDLSLINDLSKDTIHPFTFDWLFKYRDTTIQNRFKTDNKLKKVVAGLIQDFNNHPKIDPSLLYLKEIEVETMTLDKFYSFLHRGKRYRKNAWEKIKKKYGTDLVFQLSRVNYLDKYASFYYSYHCGGLCGSGNFVIMEKIQGKWKILKSFELWVS
ncbi:hypothetical protein [Flagellimonas beolgyonensis]|uniref:hypothetical protein n=1 Tax=Flagellimonas beolgyonensis TaxID=864064 RepID=UPI003D648D1F